MYISITDSTEDATISVIENITTVKCMGYGRECENGIIHYNMVVRMQVHNVLYINIYLSLSCKSAVVNASINVLSYMNSFTSSGRYRTQQQLEKIMCQP